MTSNERMDFGTQRIEDLDAFDIEFPTFPTEVSWNTMSDSLEWVHSNIVVGLNEENATEATETGTTDESDQDFWNSLRPTLTWLRSNSAQMPPTAEMSTAIRTLRSTPIHCPLCSNELMFQDYFTHLSEEHPLTYQIWLYFSSPESLNITGNIGDMMDVDQMSYDELLNLCDTVGYHTKGLTEEQKERVIEPCDVSELSSGRCTICLTAFVDTGSEDTLDIVKLRSCPPADNAHAFCKACIYEWLSNHKTCPVCIQDVVPS